MKAMFTIRRINTSAIQQEVKVVEKTVRTVRVENGDEIVCLVRGTAKVFADGREVEIQNAKLVDVVEVVKP